MNENHDDRWSDAEPYTGQPSAYSDAYYRSAPREKFTAYGYNPAHCYTGEDVPYRHRERIGLKGIIALCLVCVIVAGVLGMSGMYVLFRDRLSPQTDPATAETTTELYAQVIQARASTLSSPLSTSAVSPEATPMPAEEIYPMACRQVVGVLVGGVSGQADIFGSGVILCEDGYIITNYHVIQNGYNYDKTITVFLHDGTEYEAQIVGVEPDSDLAVLKIDATGLEPAALGDSSALVVGQAVYAVGNPLGQLAYTMTSGIVSALDRLITTDENVTVNMFQFDAAVNTGNSGGPVYNAYGQVVGIVTAKFTNAGMEGLGFAIPIADACAIANDLITKGYVSGKAYLGLTLTSVSPSVAMYYNMVPGAYIYDVEDGSAAQTAGLRTGDIITAIDGTEVADKEDMLQAVRQYRAGDTAFLTVYRNLDYITVPVIFDEDVPEDIAAAMAEDALSSDEPSDGPSGEPSPDPVAS